MSKFYLHDGEKQTGPFSVNELKEKQITPDSHVWFDGIADWAMASDVPELSNLFNPVPPPFRLSSAIENYTIIEEQSIYPKTINIVGNDAKIENLMVLFLGINRELSGKHAFEKANLKTRKELDSYIAKVKKKRDLDIRNIKTSAAINDLDELLAFLCSCDQRQKANLLTQKLLDNDSYSEALDYVNSIIKKYNVDMSIETERDKSRTHDWRKLKINQIIAIIIMVFVTFQLYILQSELSQGMQEVSIIKDLWNWVRDNIVALPDIFGFIDRVSFLFSFLLIGYIIKTIIMVRILFKGTYYYWGSKMYSLSTIFGLLCLFECIMFGFQFGFSPFWDFLKSSLVLELPCVFCSIVIE